MRFGARFQVAWLLLACACGKPQRAGDPCDTRTAFLCESEDAALECRSGVWVALPCRGPDGCKHIGTRIHCDVSANLEGDACAYTLEGDGICAVDGLSSLQCIDGTFRKAGTCSSCSVQSGVVNCRP
jgi:hypothetical protein